MIDLKSETTLKTFFFLDTYRAHKIDKLHGRCRHPLEYLLAEALQNYENKSRGPGTRPTANSTAVITTQRTSLNGNYRDRINRSAFKFYSGFSDLFNRNLGKR